MHAIDPSLSNEKFDRLLLDHLNIGACLIDLHMKVVTWNKTMSDWFPIENGYPTPKCFHMFNNQNFPKSCFACPVLEALSDYQTHEKKCYHVLDNRKQTFKITASPIIHNNGQLFGIVQLFEKLSDQGDNQHVDTVNPEKEVFLANMSHELRTPLNGILGYAQILLSDNTLNEKQKNAIHIINKSGNQLLTLITDLLELSKIKAGHRIYQPTDVHFQALLLQIFEIIKLKADKGNIPFTYTMPDLLYDYVIVDDQMLKQTLITLLDFLIKSSNQKSVHFSVHVIQHALKEITFRFSFEELNGNDMLNASGEKNAAQPDEITPVKKSTGVVLFGLEISKQLIQLMNSELQVEPRLNQGSMFWFDLTVPISTKFNTQTSDNQLDNDLLPQKKSIIFVDHTEENKLLLTEKQNINPGVELISPPKDILKRIKDYCRIGDIFSIYEELDKLIHIDHQYEKFVNKIGELADQMQLKKIIEFIQKLIHE